MNTVTDFAPWRPRGARPALLLAATLLVAACAQDPGVPPSSRSAPVRPGPGPSGAAGSGAPLESGRAEVPPPPDAAAGAPDSRPVTAENKAQTSERGLASWYGRPFHGRRTASGERFNMHALTAAHRTLPLPSYIRVRNLANGKSVVVRVNDRGPFIRGRIVDLSLAAARAIGVHGVAQVELERVPPP